MNLIDQLGTQHTFETAPQRIVSLVPSQTELLYDLGLEENIIQITINPIKNIEPKEIHLNSTCITKQNINNDSENNSEENNSEENNLGNE